MEFNPDKCEILRIYRKRNPVIFPYTLHNKQLKSTDHSKYLGVTISNNLTWAKHINNITAKANNTLRFIKRNVKSKNRKVKEAAYNTYVRPQLEYCSVVWHPWQKYLTDKLELVQRSAARYVLNDYDRESSVSAMLATLGWKTLRQRRERASLIMLYKIIHGLVGVDHHHLTHTRGGNYHIPHSRTQCHQFSFFPRAIRLWNGLPAGVQSCPTVQSFSNGLDAVGW